MKLQTLPATARRAIVRAIAVLDSAAFVSQPGDTARPLADLRAAIDQDNAAQRANLAALRRPRDLAKIAAPLAQACAELAAKTRGALAPADAHAAAVYLTRNGSGFSGTLGDLYCAADPKNRARIVAAFPEIFAEALAEARAG